MKKSFFSILIALAMVLAACGGSEDTKKSSENGVTEVPGSTVIEPSETEKDAPKMTVFGPYEVDPSAVTDKNKDVYQEPEAGTYIAVTLADGASSAQGKGVVVMNNSLLINEKGAYMLSGTLTDGTVTVDVPDTDDVILYLNGVNITSKTSAPLYIRSADKVVISLMPGTENTLTDTVSSTDGTTSITAALFSHCDLAINGTGKLTVNGNANDGITTKDDLKIMSGTVEVHAADDGMVGKDSFVMRDGLVTVAAGGDGVKSSKEEAGKGFVYVSGGTLNIDAAGDGIDAATSVLLADGNVNVRSGGGSGAKTSMPGFNFSNWGNGNTNSAAAASSMKGIKAGYYIDITGGVIVIDAQENAVSSKGAIHLFGGAVHADTGNDAFHTESDFYMIRGILTSNSCEEMIEGATITIEGGVISASTRDDGLNATGYNDKTNKSAPGNYSGNPNASDQFGGANIVINGGTLSFAPLGDGIDSNGSIALNGGTITMTGPLSTDEGAFDYLGTFEINGGEFICITSAQHVNKPTSAKQAYLTLSGFTGAQGDVVAVKDASGKELLTVTAKIGWQAVYASSASFTEGSSYTITVNGKDAGTAAAVK